MCLYYKMIVLTIAIVVIFFLLAWYFLGGGNGMKSILDYMDGKIESTGKAQTTLDMTYTVWIRIDDFAYKPGVEKVIFVKGTPDLEMACPALVVDPNTNALLVKVDTYGIREIIPVHNIPAKKWMHVGITINEEEVRVYIDGLEYAVKHLVHLPNTNNASIVTSPNEGFSGVIADLKTFDRVLGQDEISGLADQLPSTGSEKDPQVFPPYQAVSWFRS